MLRHAIGVGGEVEHFIQINGRFRAGTAFADETRPHGIMEFGIITFGMLRAHKQCLNVAKDEPKRNGKVAYTRAARGLRAGTMQSESAIPLTPTLSRGEREKPTVQKPTVGS